MKRAAKWLLAVVLTPLVVAVLLVVAIYLPPVQDFLVPRVASYISEETGVHVELKRLRITPLLDIDLQQLTATTPDTLLDVNHAYVDLNFKRLFQGHIAVEEINLHEGYFNSLDLIVTTLVKGRIGDFRISADDIALRDGLVAIPAATLNDSEVEVVLRDTTDIDTTESAPIPWRITARDLSICNSHVRVLMEGESPLLVSAAIDTLQVTQGDFNLHDNVYAAQTIKAQLAVDTLLFADKNYSPLARKLAPITLSARDFLVDMEHLSLPDVQLATANSLFAGALQLPYSALEKGSADKFTADMQGRVGNRDASLVAEECGLQGLRMHSSDLNIVAHVDGNMDVLNIHKARLMADAMVDARFEGVVKDYTEYEQLFAELNFDLQTYDLSALSAMISPVQLPQMHLTGRAEKKGSAYAADALLQQGRGTATLRGTFDANTENYQVQAAIHNLNLHNFLPQDSIFELSANLKADGRGLNILSKHARLNAFVDVSQLRYGQYDIDNIQLASRLQEGHGFVDVYSDNELLGAQACAEVQLDKKLVALDNFSLDLSRIDLHALGVVDKPFKASLMLHVDGQSNLVDRHHIDGRLQAIEIVLKDTVLHPVDFDLNATLMPDSVIALAHAGDLALNLEARESIDSLLVKFTRVSDEATRQLEARDIDQSVLRALLPDVSLTMQSGEHNPICNIMKHVTGYSFSTMNASLDCSPLRGFNSNGNVFTLNTGAIALDTIQWRVMQDSTDIVQLYARVKNGPKNKQVVFDSNLKGYLTRTGVSAALQFFDAKGVKGMDIGANLTMEGEGMRLCFYPLNPIIAYRGFALNKDNFIFLGNDKRLEADVDLLADDGTGFKLYTTPNEDALQDITLSVHNFNVGELADVIPYMPNVRGMLAGDFHLIQASDMMSVGVDAQLADAQFEGAKLGTLGLNAMYLPNADGTHYVDGIVSHEGNEVLMLTGTYNPEGQGTIDATAQLERLPLSLANGFIPDQMMTLSGYALGQLEVHGTVANPKINGSLCTESMKLNSDMYSLHLRFPDDTIRIENSLIKLNQIYAYSSGKNPLVLDGTIDARNTSNIGLNIFAEAKGFELINAPKSRNAVAYGKVYVDLDARIAGTLNDMRVRGNLDVLGNTDVTYVLTDSPLTVDDQLADMVTFVDFNDTTTVVEEKDAPQHIDVQMYIGIEDAVMVHCLLSADGTNYVDLEGGGDLMMTYDTHDGIQLYGRYTVMSGKMNYTLMVMALKDVQITNGSYVEWSGDLLNPRLSIAATERVRTTVYEDKVPRSVNFNVGLDISQTLNDMGLAFTIEAPEDISISNQLATMSDESRGKVAVTMLATGMYLTDEGTVTGFSGTNALNAFLQNQIAAISSKAFSTIDMSFGVDNTDTESGSMQTDYNFSFAKRFWNNRISIIIGGKVSSGNDVHNTGQSIINNVSLEYRLDQGASRFVRLYYDRDTKSLLEQNVMEMGVGVVFRKKATRLGELFIFKKK